MRCDITLWVWENFHRVFNFRKFLFNLNSGDFRRDSHSYANDFNAKYNNGARIKGGGQKI